jgi:hypothetical protein
LSGAAGIPVLSHRSDPVLLNLVRAVVDSAIVEGLAAAVRAGVPAFVAEFLDSTETRRCCPPCEVWTTRLRGSLPCGRFRHSAAR